MIGFILSIFGCKSSSSAKDTPLPISSPLGAERGFYTYIDLMSDTSFKRVRDTDKNTLAFSYIHLDKYKTQDLPQSFLDTFESKFELLRVAGIKIILRFAYNNGPILAPDASKEQILKHITQLSPILHDNSDVIAILQAGFIGAWGEWHNSTNGLDNINDRQEILEALVDAVPNERFVQLRNPQHKFQMYSNPTNESNAFSLEYVSRVGHHNDCFLASGSDMGTYPDNQIEAYKEYISLDTLYVPMGGETCELNPPRSSCDSALEEMKRLHFSYINKDFHKDVVQNWKDQGCYDEISRKLGYRFVVHDSSFETKIKAGANLTINIQIQNQGWAAPFTPRALIVSLKDQKVELLSDVRVLLAGENKTLSVVMNVNSNLPIGEYELFLSAPDPDVRLRDKPEFSLSFTNPEFDSQAARLPLGKVTIEE